MIEESIARVAKAALRRSGWYRRRLKAQTFPGPLVLCYHAVLPDDAVRSQIPFEPLHVSERRFEEHCTAIRESCTPIGGDDFGEIWDSKKSVRLPVLVAFDDGYRNVLDVAAPILRRYEIPAILFMCTGHLKAPGLLWFDRVAAAFDETVVERLKEAPNAERAAIAATAEEKPELRRHLEIMDERGLRELASLPGWTIGGHSHTHPILSRCAPEEQEQEIATNLRELERCLGEKPTAFAYPNGRTDSDYDDATKRILQSHEIRFAFTTQPGFAGDRSRPFDVPRMLMTNGVSGTEMLHRMAVSWRR